VVDVKTFLQRLLRNKSISIGPSYIHIEGYSAKQTLQILERVESSRTSMVKA